MAPVESCSTPWKAVGSQSGMRLFGQSAAPLPSAGRVWQGRFRQHREGAVLSGRGRIAVALNAARGEPEDSADAPPPRSVLPFWPQEQEQEQPTQAGAPSEPESPEPQPASDQPASSDAPIFFPRSMLSSASFLSGQNAIEGAGGQDGDNAEPLPQEVEFLSASPEEQSRALFQAPAISDVIPHSLADEWEGMLEAAVMELDRFVEQEILKPIQLDAGDLEEQILHQWFVMHRRELFPRHPFLLAYEWRAGNNALFFQGDVLIWNGSTEILAVELKAMKDPEGTDQILESMRRRKVESQSLKGQVFALHFLAQKPQPLSLKLALMATGELPSVHGVQITNHFSEEHHAMLPEAAREELKQSYRAFRSKATVLTPAIQASWDEQNEQATDPAAKLAPLPPLEPMQFPGGDSADYGDEEINAGDLLLMNRSISSPNTNVQEQISNPTCAEEACMSVVHILSKSKNFTCGTSSMAAQIFLLFKSRGFREVVGMKLGNFLQAHCRLFLVTRRRGELTVCLTKQVAEILETRPVTVEDLRPYINPKFLASAPLGSQHSCTISSTSSSDDAEACESNVESQSSTSRMSL